MTNVYTKGLLTISKAGKGVVAKINQKIYESGETSMKEILFWKKVNVCLFVCLFGGFSSHSRIFHSYGDDTLPVKGYGLHLKPLNSEGSLAGDT